MQQISSSDRSSYQHFVLSVLLLYLVRSDSPKKKKKRIRVWNLNITADVPPKNTPVVHTCFLAQSVLCVPYKPRHALLFTICAPSRKCQAGEGGGGREGEGKKKVRQEIIITSLHHC